MGKIIFWTISDLLEICKTRQQNKFDCVIAWSGNKGNGKSTGCYRLGKKFKTFKPWHHIVYSRKDALPLLERLKYGYIMDDEAIRSSYKRNFQDPEQKLLVQMLNMYRDNFNIYSMCIPKFYALDRDLRDLITIHIHVIERGLAVVHIPRQDVLYSDDPWDVAYNKKIEDGWADRKKKNPNYKPPYHKLSTFAGYLHYNKLKKKWEDIYTQIKREKRSLIYQTEMTKEGFLKAPNEATNYERLLSLIKEGKVSKELLIQHCQINNLKYENVRAVLMKLLRNNNDSKKLATYLSENNFGIRFNDANKTKVYTPPKLSV